MQLQFLCKTAWGHQEGEIWLRAQSTALIMGVTIAIAAIEAARGNRG